MVADIFGVGSLLEQLESCKDNEIDLAGCIEPTCLLLMINLEDEIIIMAEEIVGTECLSLVEKPLSFSAMKQSDE